MSLHEWLNHLVFENLPPEALSEAQHAADAVASDRMESGWNRVRPANNHADFRNPDFRTMTAEFGDIGAKLSTAENRTHEAIAKIDRAMAALAHRLDSSERMKALSETAMNAAAEAMNATSREQAGAISNIDKTVKALSDRLTHVESGLSQGSSREAVKALEQTLSAQIAAIQAQVERAERRSAEAAGAVSFSISSLTERLNAFDPRRLADIESKVSALESRERDGQGGVKDAIQRIAQRIEADKRTGDARAAKADADAARLDQDLKRLDADLRSAMRELAARMDGAGQRDADARARLDEQLATLNARLDVASRPAEVPAGRFEAIEEQVELLSQQMAGAEKKHGEAGAAAEQALRGLGTRFEASDKRTRDALQQLQATVESILKRMETIEHAPRAPGFTSGFAPAIPQAEPPRMEMARGELAPPPPQFPAPQFPAQTPPPSGPSPFVPPPPR
ncbi:MAG TPA: FlxA-like family protein, partial [Micropepsaceae bacterium]|nr:FlxA-like family protein [Micropepsaceae bacterium]